MKPGADAQQLEVPLNTYRERVWYAYHCLPRTRGRLPGLVSLGERRGAKVLADVFHGRRDAPSKKIRAWIADVLEVSQDWLDRGEGEPPTLTGRYKAIPELDPEIIAQDPSEWARRWNALGPMIGRKSNNFQAAALSIRGYIRTEILEQVGVEARGRENSKTIVEWARHIRLAQIKATGTGWELTLPKP